MFDHVTIRVSDRDASREFYEAGLSVLGYEVSGDGDEYVEWRDFGMSQTSGSTIRNLTLVEHFDGSTWSIVPSPNPAKETDVILPSRFVFHGRAHGEDTHAVLAKNLQ